jgi:acyl-CoA thioesterase II
VQDAAVPDEFFDLQATHNTHRWFLHVTREIATGPIDRLFLFGGVGLGAGIAAMERTFGRPTIWATAQYASFAPLGSIVDFDVHEVNVGNTLTQALVVAHIHDRKILVISAALGERGGLTDQWLRAKPAPPPEDCPVVRHRLRWDKPLGTRLEMRLIDGRFPTGEPISGRSDDGRLRVWVRSSEGLPVSATFLAAVADFVVDGISNAIGVSAGGNSLDNTIRFGPMLASEWLLCDTKIEMIHRGVIHGTMKIFSESGVLMASASQSLILRLHAPPADAAG